MSKRKVSDMTMQKLKFFSRVSCRFIIVFLRLRGNKRKNHCLTDATVSYKQNEDFRLFDLGLG